MIKKLENWKIFARTSIAEFEKLSEKIPCKLNYALSKHRDAIQKLTVDFEKTRIAICEEVCRHKATE